MPIPRPPSQTGKQEKNTKSFNNLIPRPPSQVQAESKQNGGILNRAAKNLVPSFKSSVGDVYGAVRHPIRTLGAIGTAGAGVMSKAIPGIKVESDEQAAEAIGTFYKDRYGSIEKAKETFAEDPVGFAMDLSAVFSGVSGGAKILSTASKIQKVSSAASKISKVAEVASVASDPLSLAVRGAGKALGAVGKTVSPFAGKTDFKAIEAARRAGVGLTAGAQSTSPVVPLLESFSAKGLFGGKMVERVKYMKNQLSNYVDSSVKSVGSGEDVFEVGKRIIEAKDEYKSNFIKGKNALYDDFELPKGTTFKMNKTLGFVRNILEKKKSAQRVLGKSTDIGYFDNIEKALKNGYSRATDVRSAIIELSQKLNNINDPIITGNKATMVKLEAMMRSEFEANLAELYPDAASKLDEANKFYKEGIKVLDTETGKLIEKYREKPSELLPRIITSKTAAEDIPKILELIGEDKLPDIQRAIFEDIVNKSKGKTGDMLPTPSGIESGIRRYGREKLSKILDDGQMLMLDDIKTLIEAVSKGEKIMSGSQTAFLTRLGMHASLMFANFPVFLATIMGDAAASKFISSDAGQAFMKGGRSLKLHGLPEPTARQIQMFYQSGRVEGIEEKE